MISLANDNQNRGYFFCNLRSVIKNSSVYIALTFVFPVV